MFKIASSPIDRDEWTRKLTDTKAGALVTFEGWVRDHNEGHDVSSLEYQIYHELAQKEGERILNEATEKFNLHKIVCIHREGHLNLSDIAVWIGAIASHREDAFRATRYVIDEVKHRLPIWKKEHYLNRPSDWVQCQHHHHHVHFSEKEYYPKQAKLVDQEKLKNSKVMVVGAGGLGSTVLTHLARAGVGELHFLDFDKVSITNLHRQTLYTIQDVGEKKTQIASVKLKSMNPFIHIHGLDLRLDEMNATDILMGFDLIIDTTDNLRTKALIHDVSFKLKIPFISASLYQNEGVLRTFDSRKNLGCLYCHTPERTSDSLIGNCNDEGVLGAHVSILGSLEASEALEYLLQDFNQSLTHSFYYDFKNLSVMKIKNTKTCNNCEEQMNITKNELEITKEELNFPHTLIDVRLHSIKDLTSFAHDPNPVILYCSKGNQSLSMCEHFRSRGFDHFYSLKGGECSL
jgi:sulfur-carrier protein adenylyltransferase/sulfurtransferase